MERGQAVVFSATVFFLLALSLQFYTEDTSSEHVNLQIQDVELIPDSESVAYGRGYSINSTISLSGKASDPIMIRYRTQRGTAAGGLMALFSYRVLEPGEKFEASLEQNHEGTGNQKVKLSYIKIEKDLDTAQIDSKAYVFSYAERYPEHVKDNRTDVEFSFDPQRYGLPATDQASQGIEDRISSSEEKVSEFDFTVEKNGYMLHKHDITGNDMIANITVTLNENVSEGAVLDYVVCTDCSPKRTEKVFRPGESKNLMYEYNIKNQSDSVSETHSIRYIPVHKVPEDELGNSLAMELEKYVENSSQIGEKEIKLPDQEELEDMNVTTVTEAPTPTRF